MKQSLGIEEFDCLKELWSRLEPTKSEHAQCDGIIMTLIKLGFSQIQVRRFLGSGGPRFDRINKARRADRKEAALTVEEIFFNTGNGFALLSGHAE